MKRSTVVVCGVVMLLASSTARAQDAGNLGLTIAYPARIGLQWHVSDRVAVRPAVGFTRDWSENRFSDDADPSSTLESDTTSVDFEIGVPIGVAKWDNLRAYITPRYSYSRSASSAEAAFGFGPVDQVVLETSVVRSTAQTHGFGAALGLQHALHERFSIFAEAGLRYDHTTYDYERLSTGTRNALGSSAVVGAVFYFRR